LILAAALVAASGCASHPAAFRFGADLSSLDYLERQGAVFRDDGIPQDVLPMLRRHGVDTVRLRLWHTPESPDGGPDRTLRMAERVAAQGMGLLLDVHYSDTWADPGHQTKPAAWRGVDSAALQDSVRIYTRQVIAALTARGVTPDAVQIGNEITAGFLWDDGRVGGEFDTPEQWDRFAALLRAAIAGVREATPPGDTVRVVLHVDRGGDADGTVRFFDQLVARGVDFDWIGLSYYPWWHGTLGDLRRTLGVLAPRYGKPILVVETAYPWTLRWFDDVHNIVGTPEQLLSGYPAGPDGQLRFLRDVIRTVLDAPGGLGRGVVYWEPAWISVPDEGSPWENMTLFDERGNLLPAVGAFERPWGGE